MTRKDYAKFAAAIVRIKKSFSHSTDAPAILEFAEIQIADIFAADNPRFDRTRFELACIPISHRSEEVGE